VFTALGAAQAARAQDLPQGEDRRDPHGVGVLLNPHGHQEDGGGWDRRMASTQQPGTPVSGFQSGVPLVPQRRPQPMAEVAALVESVGTNDAAFEVIVGQGRLLTLKENLAAPGRPRPVIAVGDPSVIDFTVVGPRQIRILGQRIGSTDLSITNADGRTISIEVNVVADLNVLRTQLKATFPTASLKLTQIRDSLVVEGQARDVNDVARIIESIRAYLTSIMIAQGRRVSGQSAGEGPPPTPAARAAAAQAAAAQLPPLGFRQPVPGAAEAIPVPPGRELPLPPPGADVYPEQQQLSITGSIAEPRIINLIKVPGPQQVLLKVRVAELNRTAMRQIGADWLAVDRDTGTIVGTQIGGAGVAATSTITRAGITGIANAALGPSNTVFGIFEKSDFEFFLSALRRNTLLKILAEPNLVALNGEQASFLAGGEFPVPVPQVGASGVAPTITVQFREFGVRLGFVPFIQDDDVIRLTVDPEVSNIDFSIGTTLVAGGSVVPGLNTRKAHTTVELRQGQTLMIAGLLQLTLDGNAQRIPGLGDLPIIGPFFSNTTGTRQEKELVVLVTPYLVEPMNCDQVPPTPGDEVREPNDLERYFLGRLEGRTGREFRSTTHYDDPFHLIHHVNLEKKYISGPCGFSE
jgi:pilus assembly protein CpaC